jgi:hypothetical protein
MDALFDMSVVISVYKVKQLAELRTVTEPTRYTLKNVNGNFDYIESNHKFN